MKKYILLLILLPLLSCNKWLNVESEKSVTYINYFKSESDLESMYNAILENEKFVYAPYNLLARDYCGLYVDTYAPDIKAYIELDSKKYLNDSRSKYWQIRYSIIGLADVIIDNKHRFENISDDRAEFWLGQAYFAKALMYFNLACIWGECPISKGSEAIEPEPKQSVDNVIAKAIECAEKALVLPIHSKLTDSKGNAITTRQYASLGTVHTLLANIYAWRGGLYNKKEDWAKAEEYASNVIEGKVGSYSLEPDTESLVKNVFGSKRTSPETIFVIENNELDENRFDTHQFNPRCIGQQLIDYPYTKGDPSIMDNAVDENKVSVKFIKALYNDPLDKRRVSFWYKLGEVTYEKYGYPYTSKTAYINKWREVIRSENPEDIDNPIISMDCDICVWRLADIKLLRAEARARQGLATAVEDLDDIRRRAGLEAYAGLKDSENLRYEIFKERNRELYGEGQRYFDIVRNGYWKTELMGKYKYLSDEDIKNGALYLPVGQNAFIKNTLMKQNIYWLWQQ